MRISNVLVQFEDGTVYEAVNRKPPDSDGATLAVRACREQLAKWMIDHSFATGHGDSIEDLLGELSFQARELRARVEHYRSSEVEGV